MFNQHTIGRESISQGIMVYRSKILKALYPILAHLREDPLDQIIPFGETSSNDLLMKMRTVSHCVVIEVS